MKIRLPRGYSIDTRRKGITVWPCPVCGYGALSPAGRDRHVSKKHKRSR